MTDTRPALGVARFRDPAGAVTGAGFLVTSELVLTCAHVLGDGHAPEPPDGPVTVEFPLARAGAQATVVSWSPIRPDGGGDSAVLRLTSVPPPGVHPARLTAAKPGWGEQVRVFGFPADLSEYGTWAAAELRHEQAAGWLQVESTTPGRVIEPGFSGAPVWGPSGVIGMVVAADRGAGHDTGYLLPVRSLVETHPMLGAPDPAERSPYRGLEAFREQDAELFRGRDALTDDLVGLAGRQGLILVTGPSGSGKSSLVHAGLVPRLRAAGRAVSSIRALPGATPEMLLAELLQPILDPSDPAGPDAPGPDSPQRRSAVDRLDDTRRLAQRLTGDERAITLRWLAGRLDERAGSLLLVVDQLEEIGPDDARALVDLLHDLVRLTGAPRVVAVATLRSSMIDDVVTDTTRAAVRAGWVPVPPMTTGQLRDAVTPPGPVFEPGLVQRLIDDAAGEPGQLPLLEFTLHRLWALRELGTLTYSAYDRVGGVSGAVARYAGDVYRDLGPADRARARRLLTALARPVEDGGFQRRAARVADLDPDLIGVLDRLALARLVTVGPAADGADVADLAHQALIAHWGLLRDWLEADREFQVWRDNLRRGRASWAGSGRDPGGLLRGAALVTARSWSAERPGDIAAEDRAYIEAGAALERRRIRRLRTIIAVVSVLALLAGGSAVVALVRNNVATERLRTLASRQLADDSLRFRSTDSSKALQLAQAAWREEETPEAYGALFSQYAALQPVDRIMHGVWSRRLDRMSASRDGGTAIFANDQGAGALWTGLMGDDPRAVKLSSGAGPALIGGTSQVSPSGRWVAYANDLGGVAIWDVSRPAEPRRLAPTGDQSGAPTLTVGAIAFAPDDSRVLVLRHRINGNSAELRVWETATGTAVPVPAGLPNPELLLEQAWFGPDRDRIVLSGWQSGVAVHDLRTGRNLRQFPPRSLNEGLIGATGAAVLNCPETTLQIVDTVSGREQRKVVLPTCAGVTIDATTDFAVLREGGAGGNNGHLTLVEVRSGRTYRVFIPPVALSDSKDPAPQLSVHTGADGVPVLLLADRGGMLYRIRAGAPVTIPAPAGERKILRMDSEVSQDLRYLLEVDVSGRLDLSELATGAVVTSVNAPRPPATTLYNGEYFTFTPDTRRLLIAEGSELVVRAVPDLAEERRIPLPVPPDLGDLEAEGVTDAWATSVLPAGGDRAVILHAGQLMQVDLAAGRVAGDPLPVRPGETVLRRRLGAQVVFAPALAPDNPDRVAVVADDQVQIWSMSARRMLTRVEWPAKIQPGAVVLDRAGGRFASAAKDGLTRVWRVENPGVGDLLPTVIGDSLLGFTPKGDVVVAHTGQPSGAQIWNPARGKQLATLATAAYSENWRLAGTRLTFSGGGWSRSLELDPAMWFRDLCAKNDRPFTPDELRTVKDDEGRTDRPCG